MKSVLFVDRDGTIIKEPADEQIDSLEKLEFLPYAISSLKKLQNLGFTLVMVSNQDGLGTASFPTETFWGPQNKMLEILQNEGVIFEEIFIDASLPLENSPNRKPGIGMLINYLSSNSINLENSFTIGDRITDIKLARNIGCKSIYIEVATTLAAKAEEASTVIPGFAAPTSEASLEVPSSTKAEADFSSSSWLDITAYLRKRSGRQVILDRNTAETRIHVELNLDGEGIHEIDTGLKFYDHMLDQLSRHSGMNLKLTVKGDLEIDEHHTIEDSAIALGMAMREAMGDKKGMERYGFLLPMDEALVQCAIDFSGRSWFIFSGKFDREYVGDFPTEMLEHWMKSFSDHAGLNLNLNILAGQNTHHKIEASFKALARCIRQAINVTSEVLPTTKGVI